MKKRVPTIYHYRKYKKKRIWQFVDFDWYYWNQCVDLIRDYCWDVYNYNMGRLPKAKDASLATTFPWWKRIELHDWIKAKPWDIGVTGGTKYGHIFIFDKVYNNGYDILEQNGVGGWKKIPWNEIRVRSLKRGKPPLLRYFRYVW